MIARTQKRMRRCCWLLALNLAFIWGNSLLPGEVSGALSGWVHLLIQTIFPGEGEIGQSHGLLRKMAHFSEFCTLGMLLSWLFAMLRPKTWTFIIPALVCGCIAAFMDEGIQMLIPGRGPGITDVGIDSLGVAAGIGLLCLGHTIYKKRKQHIHFGGNKT